MFGKLGIERNFLNTIKDIYDKFMVDNIFHREIWSTFSSMIPTRPRSPLSSLLFNILLEVLDHEIRQEKELKNTKIRKEDAKLSLSTGDMVGYLC